MIPAFGFASIRRTRPPVTFTAHYGVGIQHHHIAVLPPPTAEVITLPLYAHAAAATTVEDLALRPALRQSAPSIFAPPRRCPGCSYRSGYRHIKVLGITAGFYRLPQVARSPRIRGQRLVTDIGMISAVRCPDSTAHSRPLTRRYRTIAADKAAGSPSAQSRNPRNPTKSTAKRIRIPTAAHIRQQLHKGDPQVLVPPCPPG